MKITLTLDTARLNERCRPVVERYARGTLSGLNPPRDHLWRKRDLQDLLGWLFLPSHVEIADEPDPGPTLPALEVE